MLNVNKRNMRSHMTDWHDMMWNSETCLFFGTDYRQTAIRWLHDLHDLDK